MRIAIPLEQDQVHQHVGHCPSYLIADVDGTTVVQTTVVPNPHHGPGGPPPMYLARLGVNQVLGWGAPAHVLPIFDHLGIKVTLGARGEARQVLDRFLAGTLELTDEGTEVECHHDHDHHDHDHGHDDHGR